ncbi:MAG: TolC family protein [Pirellulaceae bacterium]|nr:TolC family protein [Pirellulaceae bacterium]
MARIFECTNVTSCFNLTMLLLALLTLCTSCSRRHYRLRADDEAQCLLRSRIVDPTWDMPSRSVEPDPTSRMALGGDPDCGPQPCDDPAANRWQRNPYRFRQNYWDRIPKTNEIENPTWLDFLPRNEEGKIVVTPDFANDLALIHNREFQTQFEQIYVGALRLSSNRFEFDTQWLGQLSSDYVARGDGSDSLLAVGDRLGFQRNLAAGGEFFVSLLNAFTFQFAGGQVSSASGSIVAGFTQPLLRNAGRFVRLEGLTQAERDLLYQVREFARFRRQFYLEVQEQYFSLLVQKQGILNQRNNLDSLRLNLEEHEFMLALGTVPPITVDQIFQQYQSGRIALFSAEQALLNALDNFKFFLGLPPWVEIEIDDSYLKDFQFTSDTVASLDSQIADLNRRLLPQLDREDAPDAEQLLQLYQVYLTLQKELANLLPVIGDDVNHWQQRIKDAKQNIRSADDKIDIEQQERLVQQLKQRLDALAELIADKTTETSVEEEITKLQRAVDTVDPNRPESVQELEIVGERVRRLMQAAVEKRLGEQIGELFIAQTQASLFTLEIEPVDLNEAEAIQFALGSRLDLMNRRGELVDAFRRVEIAANQLSSGLDVQSSVALGTDPNRTNAFRFDSKENVYRVGVQFDGPLNRLNERNAYRASQIAYDQSRRRFMASEDAVANSVRRNLRELQIRRLNFQIARQQYVAATRQVDEARLKLRTTSEGDSNLTRDLLTSLDQLLNVQNNIVANWVDFRLAKIRLFTELELLFLDDQGKWINEIDGLEFLKSQLEDADFDDFPRVELNSIELPDLDSFGDAPLDEIDK